MIRITELALPLDYTPEALRAAIVRRLKIRDDDLLEWTLFKRSYDARKKHTGILFICIVDVKVADEGRVLARFARDRQVGPAPDTSYHPVAKALATLNIASASPAPRRSTAAAASRVSPWRPTIEYASASSASSAGCRGFTRRSCSASSIAR